MTASTVAQSWKAVVAFLAPGLLLLLEPLVLGDQQLEGYDLRRALVVSVVTSVLVYLKRNGVSSDPTTSTPEHDAGEVAWGTVAIAVLATLLFLLLLGAFGAGDAFAGSTWN